MIASTVTGTVLHDRLSTETRDTTSVVRVEALEKRIDQLQTQQNGSLTASQFSEFRTGQDKRLDEIQTDIRDLMAEVTASYRLRTR